ncbi:hypothetical protein C2G38_907721 [Gigaspora rosea]|uniref:Uncharacterized protein n=1 Tax=Gigaspora rosea TaxID=44941 RepID=A0A397W726_9GLOM|nr:hypothetical protein C2G38_907721 [Gigaspora rosea]
MILCLKTHMLKQDDIHIMLQLLISYMKKQLFFFYNIFKMYFIIVGKAFQFSTKKLQRMPRK